MALTFAGASDRDEVADAASIADLTDWTLFTWWMIAATGTAQALAFKTGNRGFNVTGGAALQNFVVRATLNQGCVAALSSFAAYATSKWLCTAMIGTTTGADTDNKLLMGSFTEAMLEPSAYTQQRSGTGAVTSDAGVFRIGNNAAGTQRWQDKIAVVQYYNRRLSQGECERLRMGVAPVLSGCVLYHELGWNGTGTQADWSGNGNNGTVTGGAAALHVPLRPRFGGVNGWRGNYTAPAVGGTTGGRRLVNAGLINRGLINGGLAA